MLRLIKAFGALGVTFSRKRNRSGYFYLQFAVVVGVLFSARPGLCFFSNSEAFASGMV